MDLWIVSPDPSVPLTKTNTLSNGQLQDVQTGKLFLVRASSPVFAKSLADGIRGLASRIQAMDPEELEKESLWRRPVQMTRRGEPVPVYEARLYWPT